MKKFLKELALFGIILSLVYPILVFIWFQFINPKFGLSALWPYSHYAYSRLDLQKNSFDSLDYMVLGSSHAYCSINPAYFEEEKIKMYNLGSAIQSPYFSKWMIETYFPIMKPKIVILEVFAISTLSKSPEAAIDFAFNHPFNHLTEQFKFLTENFYLRIFNGLCYNFFASYFNLFHLKTPSENKFIKGYSASNKIFKISKKNYPDRMLEIYPSYIQELNDLIEIITHKYKKKLILVYAPIPHKIYKTLKNHDEYIQILMKFSQKYQIPFYNFNLMPQFDDDKHFYDDYGHLNLEGGNIFNQMLIDSLKKDGFIP